MFCQHNISIRSTKSRQPSQYYPQYNLILVPRTTNASDVCKKLLRFKTLPYLKEQYKKQYKQKQNKIDPFSYI